MCERVRTLSGLNSLGGDDLSTRAVWRIILRGQIDSSDSFSEDEGFRW